MEDLVEVIREGQIMRVPRELANEEGLVILRKPIVQSGYVPPSRSPIKSAEARQNMRGSIIGAKHSSRKELVDNFQWHISRGRKIKNLSRHQLANILGTSEETVIALENGELPRDSESLILKLEQYLGIKIRGISALGGSLGEPPPAPKPPLREHQASYSKDITLAELQKRKEMTRKIEPKQMLGKDVELID